MWQDDFSKNTASNDELHINSNGTLIIDSKDDMGKIFFRRGITRSILLYSSYTQNETALITDNLECVFLQEGFGYSDISMLCETYVF